MDRIDDASWHGLLRRGATNHFRTALWPG